jgi:hypothetical protein
MNKLILISLIIFFTICSKSWSNDLVCEGIDGPWHPQVWFFDDDGEIHHIDFDNSRIEGMFVSEKTSYGNNAEFIIWTSIYANSNFVLSRKTLELKLQQWDHNQSKTVYFYYQCRVTNWEGIEEFFKPQMDKHKENLKKNKI